MWFWLDLALVAWGGERRNDGQEVYLEVVSYLGYEVT